jgi:hypothetical protein
MKKFITTSILLMCLFTGLMAYWDFRTSYGTTDTERGSFSQTYGMKFGFPINDNSWFIGGDLQLYTSKIRMEREDRFGFYFAPNFTYYPVPLIQVSASGGMVLNERSQVHEFVPAINVSTGLDLGKNHAFLIGINYFQVFSDYKDVTMIGAFVKYRFFRMKAAGGVANLINLQNKLLLNDKLKNDWQVLLVILKKLR